MASGKEPDCLKFLSPILKTGKEFVKRDPVITYFCYVYAIQKSLSMFGKKRPKEADMFLMGMMGQVEQMKMQLVGEEAITSEIVAQAHVESKALQLFTYADNEDRGGRFGKNVVKAFYTSHILFEVLGQFGELSVELMEKQKYAKWKAAYISRCLKDGETPIAGPIGGEEEDEPQASGGAEIPSAAAAAMGGGTAAYGQPPIQPGMGAQQPSVGFGELGMGGMAAGQSDPSNIPGFVQPMNPLSSFVPPTNPQATFDQPPPSYSQPGPGGFGPPPTSAQSPAASMHSQPTFDPSAAAAANAAAMAAAQPHSLTPTASPGGSLQPMPAPRQHNPNKPFPIPTSGEFKVLNFEQKARLEKLMKFASSALMYDDMITVAQNLSRAHNLVYHGKEE